MPRVTHVKAARKDNSVCKKGESYFWWKFRFGGKRYSLTRPRPSQLTQSAYYGSIRGLVEQIEDSSPDSFEDFESLQQEMSEEIQNIGSETQDSLDNMPESLQYSPTGELLQERIDACENASGEIECITEFEFDREDYDREDFDESDYEDDTEDERADAEEDHEREQDKREADHEDDEDGREQSEFEDWINGAKDELVSAIAECEV